MRTPKEFRANLDAGIITATMLSAALHSVNKRAKNYRDHERLDKRLYGWDSKYTASQREKKEAFYSKKERLLSILSPVCVHQEYVGCERERVYSYQSNYDRKFFSAWLNGLTVWGNVYWDYKRDCEVEFFDRILPDEPRYRYYLYYCVGAQTFHTPIDRPERYPDLPVKKIGTLDTTGEQPTDLLSVQFADKMLRLIESGNFQYREDVAAILPEYPETEMQFMPEKPDWTSVWRYISNDLLKLCKIKWMSEFSSTLKPSLSLEKDVFQLKQKQKRSRRDKTEADIFKKPRIFALEAKLDSPCMTPELETYLAALDTSDISRWEYVQYLVEPESPIRERLVDFVKEYVRRENTKKCLREIAEELYTKEAGKIKLNEVWEIFLERYVNSGQLSAA